MSTPTTPRGELAQAIRMVNSRFSRLTPEEQDRCTMVDLQPVEAALKSGSELRSFAAVSAWCAEQLDAIREVRR